MSMSSMDGMSSMGMTGQQGAMTAYLHFTPLGDTLWFQYWVPTSPAAVLGACIGLFMLAIVERWIAAGRAVAERAWTQSAQLEILYKLNQSQQSNNQPLLKPESKPVEPASDSKTTLKSPSSRPQSAQSSYFGGRFPRFRYTTTSIIPGPPFIASHDISRGILQAVQTALMYLFMLAAMTFQAGFIISMCLGAGVGEMMFGRHITAVSSHH